MPKELINSRYNGDIVERIKPDGSVEMVTLAAPFLHIGWNRDCEHVEIATHPGGHYMAGDERPGWFVQLDRNSINRLIRTLRKARDAAYGTDA